MAFWISPISEDITKGLVTGLKENLRVAVIVDNSPRGSQTSAHVCIIKILIPLINTLVSALGISPHCIDEEN